MRCPFCKSILENGYCKTCERQIHELYHHPKLEERKREKERENTDKADQEEVIEPEIVEDSDTGYQNSKRTYSGFRESPLFAQYTMHSAGINDSCLTGIISLALIFFVFLQMGFLAALGFAFFTFIGKILSLIITFKSIINGKIIPPLVLDIAVWIVSDCLVTWLS